MGDFSAMNYPFFPDPSAMYLQPPPPQTPDQNMTMNQKPNDPPPPPPVVICPSEVDHINITLEKNQQCQCKDCGKLFNSVWYLKQHAVKHSNDRPFKCKFCFKTYKFRSNLYQHKCPDRQKAGNAKRLETNQLLKSRIEANMSADDLAAYQAGSVSDNEENDIPITYGLLIHKFEEPRKEEPQNDKKPENKTVPQQQDGEKKQDCVREQQLPEQEIKNYISENKNRLHTCRKCRLLFPTAASLMRHSAAHNRDDMFPFKCTNCRQAFETAKELRHHSLMHAGIGPWKCDYCNGVFRSSHALRRHHDQCRTCNLPQDQSEIIVSAHSPLDPFSFIPSELDLCGNKKSPDSGVGSSPDHRTSPEGASILEVDPYEMYGKKKEKEDDEDSGFRSRLNSVTQSSPGSSVFSLEGCSPHRKMSEETSGLFSDGFGSGPNYGQSLFGNFDSSEFNDSLLLDQHATSIWGH